MKIFVIFINLLYNYVYRNASAELPKFFFFSLGKSEKSMEKRQGVWYNTKNSVTVNEWSFSYLSLRQLTLTPPSSEGGKAVTRRAFPRGVMPAKHCRRKRHEPESLFVQRKRCLSLWRYACQTLRRETALIKASPYKGSNASQNHKENTAN